MVLSCYSVCEVENTRSISTNFGCLSLCFGIAQLSLVLLVLYWVNCSNRNNSFVLADRPEHRGVKKEFIKVTKSLPEFVNRFRFRALIQSNSDCRIWQIRYRDLWMTIFLWVLSHRTGMAPLAIVQDLADPNSHYISDVNKRMFSWQFSLMLQWLGKNFFCCSRNVINGCICRNKWVNICRSLLDF